MHTVKFDSIANKILLTLSGLIISTLGILDITSFIKKFMHSY